jgi:hypothetical protein
MEAALHAFRATMCTAPRAMMEKKGGLEPFVTLLLEDLTDGGYTVRTLPVPGVMLESEVGKEFMASIYLPAVIAQVNGDMVRIRALSWCSEAWVREKANDGQPVPGDWRKLPRTEAVIVTLEHAGGTELYSLPVDRSQGQVRVGPARDMGMPSGSEGRLAGLFQRVA